MLLLLFYLINALIVSTAHGAINLAEKPIICFFNGNKVDSQNPKTPVTDPCDIPTDCEVIAFTGSSITSNAEFTYDKGILQQVMKLGRPVLLVIYRYGGFADWGKILASPDGNPVDAKAITDFVTSNGMNGVILNGIAPIQGDTPNANIANNIIPYMHNLKVCKDFIVGVSIDPYGNKLTDPNVYNFEGMNNIADLYVVNTFALNGYCDLPYFNGGSPIYGSQGLIGLDTIVAMMKNTKITVTKVYLVAELMADVPNLSEFTSYSEVCLGEANTTTWCVPTTKDYCDKGKFIHDQNFGVLVMWIEYDDSADKCECGPFIGFANIVAGFKNKSQIPCAKFDVKAGTS